MSLIRQKRRERQAKHISSKKAYDSESNTWIDNPELDKIIEKEDV